MMHRNSQQRIYENYVYFITCAVEGKDEFFRQELFCDLWIEELKLTKEIDHFKLLAFCLNYDHFHLIIKPDNTIANYSEIMHFLKRHFARNANIILGYNPFPDKKLIDDEIEGDVGQRRLQNHEPWQNEMDKFVIQTRNKFLEKHGTHHNLPKFKWQKSFHDHIIRDQKDLENHWNYTMNNFIKHALPEDWRYTGLNFTELIDAIE